MNEFPLRTEIKQKRYHFITVLVVLANAKRQEEIKGFGCWKGIKNQCKSWVGERIPEGEQSPCAPGSAPQVPKWTTLRTGAAQLGEEELGS